MADSDDKSGSPLQPNKITNQQLKDTLGERLSFLRASLDEFCAIHQFFTTAIESINNPDHDKIPAEQWLLGMVLTGHWLHGLCEDHLEQTLAIDEWVDSCEVVPEPTAP